MKNKKFTGENINIHYFLLLLISYIFKVKHQKIENQLKIVNIDQFFIFHYATLSFDWNMYCDFFDRTGSGRYRGYIEAKMKLTFNDDLH